MNPAAVSCFLYHKTHIPSIKIGAMAEQVSPRANSAGLWALILGSASFLFQGRQLIAGNSDTWNDMALISAVLATIYGFIISNRGRNWALGMAGGTLGIMMLFDMFLFRGFQDIIHSISDLMPVGVSAEAFVTFGLIIASIYFVLIKPGKAEKKV